MTGGFQTAVSTIPVIGFAGDWASSNPRDFVLAGPGGLIAGPAGVTIGNFAWATYPADPDGSPAIVNSFGIGAPTGFVHREQQGLDSTYLSNAGNTILGGFPLTLTSNADVLVKNAGAAQAQVGMKAFAKISDGSVSFAAAGTIPGGASGATASIAAETWSATNASITGAILDTTSASCVITGTIYPGSSITSNGVGNVVKQLTGTPGGAGTYLLDTGEQAISSLTIGGAYGLLSNGTVTGAFAVGQVLTGSGVAAGTVVTQLVTGAGGTGGTTVVNNNTVVSSTTIVGSNSVETRWFARSTGLTGEIVKISPKQYG